MDAVLISPVVPFDLRRGWTLAVLSDVRALLDNKLDLGIIAFTYGDEQYSFPDLCPTIRVASESGGFASRFVRSIFKRLPPSTERLYSSESRKVVCDTLRKWLPKLVIIDDSSVAGYIPDIRSIVPNAKIVVRSHNVMHDIREEQLSRAKGPTRPAIAFDCRRYIEFEKTAILSSDANWAITDADAARFQQLYNKPTECLTVSVPVERYESLPLDQGQKNGFVHVGCLDFRRRHDLSHFLDHVWPRILKADDSACLTMAGELKGNPIPATNVSYAGRVPDDAEVYSSARFALNFQSSIGGVKLKTLTSMAAGRTLVSTREGVEGINIESGKQFFDIEDFLNRNNLRSLLNDVRSTQSIADAGRTYVRTHHSRPAVAKRILNLLEAV